MQKSILAMMVLVATSAFGPWINSGGEQKMGIDIFTMGGLIEQKSFTHTIPFDLNAAQGVGSGVWDYRGPAFELAAPPGRLN